MSRIVYPGLALVRPGLQPPMVTVKQLNPALQYCYGVAEQEIPSYNMGVMVRSGSAVDS